MYVCICHRVRECEIRRVIQSGAHSEDAVGDECGAGTGCGTCLDRIADLIDAENAGAVPVFT
ncbi:(2Fe-2S)-binding protein [Dactylosporangium darangshiense]|uniref:Bacterioferritin-associated ferredoxin n=1 Tax=Dactylosporangium darangshiense TaxID=579108 RepID=A0ABP8D466_9ACTN